MDYETQIEILNFLYKLEDKFEYDQTEIGLEVGELINKIQNQLYENRQQENTKGN